MIGWVVFLRVGPQDMAMCSTIGWYWIMVIIGLTYQGDNDHSPIDIIEC